MMEKTSVGTYAYVPNVINNALKSSNLNHDELRFGASVSELLLCFVISLAIRRPVSMDHQP